MPISTGLKKNLDLSHKEKLLLIDRTNRELSISHQAELIGISRSSIYYEPVVDEYGLLLKRLIDEQSSQGPRAEFRLAIEQAQPNKGHHALVELERLGILKLIITQNVDNLHRAAGSANVAEIHGNRTRLRCLNCLARYPRSEFVTDTLPPRCLRCGGPQS